MIRTQELVPDYYIEKSRDFQTFCRILDYLFNSTKYNSKSLLNITDTERAKNTVLPLIGDKFGIYDKEAYSTREMLDALPSALQYKGSMHSALTLIHAFLDSMDIFDYATVYNAKNAKSAAEVSEILRREISPYTLVIVLSSYPNLTKLRVLDTYLKMVIPTGMYIDYVFGFNKKIIDKYKYKEFVLLYYTKEKVVTNIDESNTHQQVSLVRNKDDYYTYGDEAGDIANMPEGPDKEFVKKVSQENANILVNSIGIASVENEGDRKEQDEG